MCVSVCAHPRVCDSVCVWVRACVRACACHRNILKAVSFFFKAVSFKNVTEILLECQRVCICVYVAVTPSGLAKDICSSIDNSAMDY